MKIFLKNLKPFISYWAAFAVYFVFPFFGLADLTALWRALPLILLCVFNLITGCTDSIGEIKWGVSLFSLQLFVCGILQLLPAAPGGRLAVLGNFISSTVLVFPGVDSAFAAAAFMLLSVLLSAAPFFIGAGIKKRREKSTAAKQLL